MSKSNIFDNYGAWLITRVGFKRRGYSKLFEQLHHIPFTWTIPRDKNRALDGMRLRNEYWKTLLGNTPDCLKEDLFEPECSLLEMLVGLAIRVELEYTGTTVEDHPEIFFWEMCCNLGLDRFKNRNFGCEFTCELLEICELFVKRGYKKDGNGSIFPILHPSRDQRKLEIWDQLQAYLHEKWQK